jgi:hypothetical protein
LKSLFTYILSGEVFKCSERTRLWQGGGAVFYYQSGDVVQQSNTYAMCSKNWVISPAPLRETKLIEEEEKKTN